MRCVQDITAEPPAEGEIVDPRTWFDSPGPFELEIGCGKGGYLLARARAHQHIRMLGIEWANRYYRFCADRLCRWGITNVRVMRTDARTFVLRHLAPGCVSVLHLYHPDPWPKKRHHKRRLVQADFVEAAARVLEPGGHWLIQSDHHEYFSHIRRLIESRPEFMDLPWDEGPGSAGSDWKGTNFEVKYARAGREIYRAVYRLRGA